MNILQALFFPPEQPGGVSSMVPYISDRFNKKGWEMELFSLPKRIRGKGKEEVEFVTFDWRKYAGNPIVDKYIQTYKDYIWWTKLRISKKYDIIHAHHPIAALAMKQIYPETPVILTIHSSFERELILNGRIQENGVEHQFLTQIYGELEARVDQIITVSNSFKQYMAEYVQDSERIGVIPNGFDEKRFRPISHESQVTQFIT
ncbi:glycosyltransferase family 4 protein, partial [Paenibacillus sp. TAF58]